MPLASGRALRFALGLALFALAPMLPNLGLLTTLLWLLDTLMVLTGMITAIYK